MAKHNEPNLAKEYQKKTQKQHIIDAPDTYVGAIDSDEIRANKLSLCFLLP